MRDMETQQVLKRAAPPRSDTASRVRWDTSKHQGRVVCVELVDGDTGGAFAWLAAGRFSEPQLNPGAMSKRIGIGAKLVADYGLERFRGRLAKLLQISHSAEVGMALARLDGSVVNESLARALSFSEAPPTIRDEIVSAVADATDDASEILVKLFSTLGVKQQLELAKGVLGDADSVALLMDLLDEGIASTRLLGDPKFVEELKLVLDGDGDRRLDGLIQEIPDESEATDDLINSRVASYRQNSGSDESGMAVFAKNCANCHQIDGQGKRFGPNLDGIGNRGVQRIVEDIVAPNRNVDVAFRSTNLSLKDGTVLSGLLRDSVVPHQFLMIDEQGKERLIPRSDIEEQSDSRLSPMPGNFGSILSEQQFRDLLAYLLKQK
jgi:putative heme-binding domain-containing protein